MDAKTFQVALAEGVEKHRQNKISEHKKQIEQHLKELELLGVNATIEYERQQVYRRVDEVERPQSCYPEGSVWESKKNHVDFDNIK